MSELTPILIATFIGSVGGLAGGILIMFNKKLIKTVSHILVPFAAGALLASSFFELFPESFEHAEELGMTMDPFTWGLIGVLLFYLLERGIHWFQFHRTAKTNKHGNVTVPLIVIGDSIHNFIDGMAIAITFMVEPTLGIVTTLAIIAHELPQEIGDFAVLLHEGLSRKKVFLINLSSALLSVLGAVIALFIGEAVEGIFPYALSLTGGLFVYIALTNLLPSIHHEEKKGYAFYETLSLFLGVAVLWFVITFLHVSH